MDKFPSMKAVQMMAVLTRKPLNYKVVHQTGSHCRLESDEFPPLTFAFHAGVTLPAGLVRKILVDSVGLEPDVARSLV